MEKEIEFFCLKCRNRKDLDCEMCGCHVCKKKSYPEYWLVCNACRMFFHPDCCARSEIPLASEIFYWICKKCLERRKRFAVEEVQARPEVRKDSIGAIKGILVGSSWLGRAQCYESGIHLSVNSSIACMDNRVTSVLLLEDEKVAILDLGEEFHLSFNQPTTTTPNNATPNNTTPNNISTNNTSTNSNFGGKPLSDESLAMALTCNAIVNSSQGGSAADWKSSSPIRVIRCSGKEKIKRNKSSPFDPKKGYRYDGIYRLVKYWPVVKEGKPPAWRFLLRRDDPEPTPWSEEGRKRLEEIFGVRPESDDPFEEESSGDEVRLISKKAKN